jgi:RNA polymerase sigma factor (sigma-70 family)
VLEPATTQDQRDRRFRRLYQDHYELIQAYVVRRVNARTDVADIVADIFMIAWRRLDKVPAPPGDTMWLYGVARRVISGKRRSLRRFANLLDRLQTNGGGRQGQCGQTAADAANDRLLAALHGLRPAEREALQLVHWERLSYAEAANVLNCSANAVGIRVHRAKAKLRAALGPATQLEPARVSRTSGRAGPSSTNCSPDAS